MRIVGVDPSLRCTGVVVLGAGLSASGHLVRSTGHRGDPWVVRAARCAEVARRVAGLCVGADLVVVEGPAYGHAAEPGFYDRAMLMGLLLDAVDAPVAVAAPATAKRWVASRGDAPKALVAARVARLLPDLEAVTLDVSDAAALALMGASHVGVLEASSSRRSVEEAVQWPAVRTSTDEDYSGAGE